MTNYAWSVCSFQIRFWIQIQILLWYEFYQSFPPWQKITEMHKLIHFHSFLKQLMMYWIGNQWALKYNATYPATVFSEQHQCTSSTQSPRALPATKLASWWSGHCKPWLDGSMLVWSLQTNQHQTIYSINCSIGKIGAITNQYQCKRKQK